MYKQSNKQFAAAALLFTTAMAQGPTVTSYFPVCPTASSTTITLAKTMTLCPGPYCNGPMVTPAPNGVGQPGVHVGEYTSVGPDALTTVLVIWETVYNSMCETGLVPATYTITEPCPCEKTAHPTVLPTGFETTVMACHVCAANGGPSTVTLTQPCATGPYATQTPSVNQPQNPVGAGSAASPASAMAGGAGAQASAGAAAQASAGSGGAYASAGAGANAQAGTMAGGSYASASAGAAAVASSGPGGSGSANSGAGAGAGSGASTPGSGAVGTVPVNGTTLRNGTVSMMPVPPSPISSYISSANKLSLTGLTIFAGVAAILLL